MQVYGVTMWGQDNVAAPGLHEPCTGSEAAIWEENPQKSPEALSEPQPLNLIIFRHSDVFNNVARGLMFIRPNFLGPGNSHN
ncbi:hypothetical protein COCCU_07185 [Corynebacterium occultum]|uniref:Uncharacterized protein n=1 Tax=Corynebacterium occultum TaxID=2675219 RepID=A0A6B8W4C3_9CORY|nr:hypothetical protein COCCU_07185 [Corynebacterium occultum]